MEELLAVCVCIENGGNTPGIIRHGHYYVRPQHLESLTHTAVLGNGLPTAPLLYPSSLKLLTVQER